MTLGDLLGSIGIDPTFPDGDREISSITEDSRQAGAGSLFFAIRGTHQDGSRYAAEAVRRGAIAVVAGAPTSTDVAVPWFQVDDERRALALAAAAFYGNPGAELELTGITGSKGKTTTAFLVASVAEAAGFPSALLSTITQHLTTPSAPFVQARLRDAVDAGLTGAIVEVSSHALDQSRVHGLEFQTGIFTNLFIDHLDYHGTMEDYFLAKRRLFVGDEAATAAVIGIDDEHGRRLANEIDGAVTFGESHGATVRLVGLDSLRSGLTLRLKIADRDEVVNSPLLGRHNGANVLAAVAFAVSRGWDLDIARQGIASLAAVPGRMEPVQAGQPFTCLVDFAHMGPALEAAIGAAREWTKGRILLVVGAGGDRDPHRRRSLGDVAARRADLTFLTSDNPRTEDPETIVKAIDEAYRASGGRDATIMLDRRAAIAAAVDAAEPDDTVLVAGKGHEREQIIGHERFPFDDRLVLGEALARRGYET